MAGKRDRSVSNANSSFFNRVLFPPNHHFSHFSSTPATDMSATATPADSPVHVQPLHNPSQAAHVVVPQAPLGNATNGLPSQAPGMGAKALLAKRISNHNPKYISPTDKMMTPVSQKLNAAKKKHFTKGAGPMLSLFPQKEAPSEPEKSSDEVEVEDDNEETPATPADKEMDDEENPF